VIRSRLVTPARRSSPEDFRRAQSRGLWPGARATLARALAFELTFGGFLIVVNGKARPPLPELELTVPLLDGMKEGGGIDLGSSASFPGARAGAADGPDDRCILDRLGKAGGLSSSSSALSPSLSESWGDSMVTVAVGGAGVGAGVVSAVTPPERNQPLKYEVIEEDKERQ